MQSHWLVQIIFLQISFESFPKDCCASCEYSSFFWNIWSCTLLSLPAKRYWSPFFFWKNDAKANMSQHCKCYNFLRQKLKCKTGWPFVYFYLILLSPLTLHILGILQSTTGLLPQCHATAPLLADIPVCALLFNNAFCATVYIWQWAQFCRIKSKEDLARIAGFCTFCLLTSPGISCY